MQGLKSNSLPPQDLQVPTISPAAPSWPPLVLQTRPTCFLHLLVLDLCYRLNRVL